MCEGDFEKVKRAVEAEDGRPLEPGDEIICRAVHGYIRGVQLRNELESGPTSEPERIGPIAERVLKDIKGRMERRRRRGVMQAMRDFFSTNQRRGQNQQQRKAEQAKVESRP